MIQGSVDDAYNALIPLQVSGTSGDSLQLAAVIDTGFNGFLTLPPSIVAELKGTLIGWSRAILADGDERLLPLYEVTVLWNDRLQTVEAEAAETDPLVGMAMMKGYALRIDVKAHGTVTLQLLASD